MNKQEFISSLASRLSSLPSEEVEERIGFYSEMIDDLIEDGRTEEEALCEIGSVDYIASQIAEDIPLIKIAKEKIKPKRRLRPWEITLIAVGSPIWFSLLVAAFSVILSLYVSVWALVISLWSVAISIAASAIALVGGGIVFIFTGKGYTGVAVIAAALVCAGLSIFAFIGCLEATCGIISVTKKAISSIKHRFVRKEAI